MRGWRRRWIWLLVIALVVSACAGGGGSDSANDVEASVSPDGASGSETETAAETPTDVEPSPTESPDPPPQPSPRPTQTVLVTDLESGEPMEVEEEIPGPLSYGEVVDEGIAEGWWDEIEGLTRVLGFAVGLVPAEQVPGATEVLTGELSELMGRANALAFSGDYSEEELAELRAVYELVAPSADAIEQIAADASEPGLPSLRMVPRQVPDECNRVDSADFSGWGVVEGCYRIYEDSVAGVTSRVIYPAWYEEDPAMAQLPLLAREASTTSLGTYESLGEVGDVDLLFSLVDTAGSSGTLAVANDTAQWGVATPAGACAITLFPAATLNTRAFQQTVAHEIWHCVQRESGYPTGVVAGTSWYEEGGAEYFSNVVYPSVNDEHSWLGTFDGGSLTKPLFAMSYEAWIWWQHLANRSSPRAVADLQHQMMLDGDGGKSAMEPYAQSFNAFVAEYIAGQVTDADGSQLPKAGQWRSDTGHVTKDDIGKVMDWDVAPFVAFRTYIKYDPDIRVLESDQTETEGPFAMVEFAKRTNLDEWREVFPEVRSKCNKAVYYAVMATTHQGTHSPRIFVEDIEEASCDPCLLGTWKMDNETWKNRLLDRMSQEGAGLPAGAEMEIRGDYYSSVAEDGVIKEQRVGFTMTFVFGGQPISIITDSFAEGRYTADGERVSSGALVEVYRIVSASVPGFQMPLPDQGADLIGESGTGSYECSQDDMTLTVDGFGSVRLYRVNKILEPDPAYFEG